MDAECKKDFSTSQASCLDGQPSIVIYVPDLYVGGGDNIDWYVGNGGVVGGDTTCSAGTGNVGSGGDTFGALE